MTLTTSSRSAKSTPKRAPKQATNGTPPTDPNSEPTSTESEAPATLPDRTIWHIEDTRGAVWEVTVVGANGRISYGRTQHRDAGEVRIYRTQTAKHYDAVIPDVTKVWSQNVMVERIGKTKETEEMEATRAAIEKERFEKVMERVLTKSVGGFDDDEKEEEPVMPAW